MRFNSQQIVLYCHGLHRENTGLSEEDLEPSPKRVSDKINLLKCNRETAKEIKSYCSLDSHMHSRT